ncbi:MAG: PAS domain S-box protein [Nibricoccus sp.]
MNTIVPNNPSFEMTSVRQEATNQTLTSGKPDPAFDDIVQLAAQIVGAPKALIGVIEAGQSRIKASYGIAPSEMPTDRSFCEYVCMEGGRELIVSDASKDTRFQHASCVIGTEGIKFYAGEPLHGPNGDILGTLCVFDSRPHVLSSDQISALRILSRQAMNQLQLEHTLALRQKETEQFTLMAQALNASTDSIVITDARLPDNPLIMVNPAFERITGYSSDDSIGRNCRFLLNNERDQPSLNILRAAIRRKQSCRVILKNFRKDGRAFWNELHIAPVRDSAGETTHFIGIQSDITARKEAEDAIRQRDVILEGVSFAAEALLNEPNLKIALPGVLERIGIATNSDHVCLWQVRSAGMAKIQLWTEPHLTTSTQAILQEMNWDPAQGWPKHEQLRNGRVIHSSSADITSEEKTLLQKHNVRTLLFLPVLTHQGVLWGALTLGCADASVILGFAEIEALRSATRVLGAVIHDRETGTALRISEERFRSVVTNLKEVVFQTNATGLWTLLNPAWEEITGFKVEQSLGQLFLDYVHPDDRERNNQLFGPLIRREKEYCRHSVRYLTNDGGHRWVEVFARLVLDDQNQIIGTAGTLNDITARKLAEQSLQKQRAAIEAAIDGVGILDESCRFTYLNSTLASMFGRETTEDLLSQPWCALFQASENTRFENDIFPQLQATGKWRGAVSALRADKSSFTAELSLTGIEGGGMVCVFRDITDRIEAEQFTLRSLKEKEVLLKEIHHRVKNNMQIVSSLLNLQLDSLQDEKTRTLFIEAQNRIASMALVHEKLYQSNNLAKIDFTDYLRELTDNLASMLGARTRNIVFQLKIADMHLGIDTAIPCGLIINELITNAYKHGYPTGGPGQVTLTFEQLPTGQLYLEVADNGRGIPAGFDLRQTKSLGMQLVHTLVKQLHGTIEIQGPPGARFILHLKENIRKEPHRS